MPKTNAEYCRDYRKKRREAKIKRTAKSSTERVREFRERQKELLNVGNDSSITHNDDSTIQNSESDHSNMPRCSVKWCGNVSIKSSYAKDGITFHRFPKIASFKNQWVTATCRDDWCPTPYSVICSKHFTEDQFKKMKDGHYRRLKQNAVPSLYIPLLVSTKYHADAIEMLSSKLDPTRATMTSKAGEMSKSMDVEEIPEGKVLIARVYQYLQKEYETLKALTNDRECLDLTSLCDILLRTANATGVSQHTVLTVVEEIKRVPASDNDSDQAERSKIHHVDIQENTIDEHSKQPIIYRNGDQSEEEDSLQDWKPDVDMNETSESTQNLTMDMPESGVKTEPPDVVEPPLVRPQFGNMLFLEVSPLTLRPPPQYDVDSKSVVGDMDESTVWDRDGDVKSDFKLDIDESITVVEHPVVNKTQDEIKTEPPDDNLQLTSTQTSDSNALPTFLNQR